MRKAGGWIILGLSRSLCLSWCLSLFVSFSISLPLSVTLSFSVSLCLSISPCLSLSLLELGHYHLLPSRLCPWTEYTTIFPRSRACRRQVECVLSLFLRSILSVSAKSLQLYPIPGDPMDCSPPGPSVHGILQAIILEWVAMPSSRGSS